MYDVVEDLLGQMTLQEKVALPCWYERTVHLSNTALRQVGRGSDSLYGASADGWKSDARDGRSDL